MITYFQLCQYPSVLLKMTGLRLGEWETLLNEVVPRFAEAEEVRLTRTERQRDPGGGDKPALAAREQILLTVIWLRLYPTHDVLGFLFGISQPTVGRYLQHVLPILEQMGRDTMRLPDPGRKRRCNLPELLRDVAEIHVVVDTFEQSIQRPKQASERNAYYSGKKRSHTLKSQVMVQGETGYIANVADSVPGRCADITRLKQSGILSCLPEGVGCLCDSAYQGIAKLHPLGRSPFKRLGGQAPPLTEEQLAYNRAFASQRIVVENTLCRMRCFQCLSQRDRQHRSGHTARVCAVAGLVNRCFQARFPI
jgi:DDE superfamily endonuclease